MTVPTHPAQQARPAASTIDRMTSPDASSPPAGPSDNAPVDPPVSPPSADPVIAETRAWLRRSVIGLNLCPFAKAPEAKGQVRYVVSDVTDVESLLAVLCVELQRLADTDASVVETTLLIHPAVLGDFEDFNDFLEVADAAVEQLQLEGVLQVASFHPAFQFADTAPADVSNATNRAPYPTLHLLREESVDRAVAAFPEAERIFEANIATMEALGRDGWATLQEAWRADARAEVAAAAAATAARAGGAGMPDTQGPSGPSGTPTAP